MKLRDKKTGKVIEVDYISVARSGFDLVDKDGNIKARDIHTLPLCYSSVRELTSEFEDYKPAEPLIKDKKIRKAVRAWARANAIIYAKKCGSTNAYTRRIVGYDALGVSFTIEFDKRLKLYGDPDKIEKDSYTIAELCGEEKE